MFYINCLIQSNVEVTVKNCNQLYNYSTVLGAAIKCKPYGEITVKIGTRLKTVKITVNIFAVNTKVQHSGSTLRFNTKLKRCTEGLPDFL